MTNKIPVAEVFCSIQGEGKSLGKPSIFVRTWGCNLRCRFGGKACDTPYAVITESEKAQIYTQDELVNKIREFYPVKHIVFTGGEPLLLQDDLANVARKLFEKDNSYTNEVETNGTISLNNLSKIAFDQFNISVKLASSNQEEGYEVKRINFGALKTYPKERSYFKFVISHDNDIEEIEEIKRHIDFPVYLMPEGMTRETIIKNAPAVIDLCLKYNYNYSPREHILVWDKQRGV